ncbi:MAG: C45 family autoproteolytic acyltransferase/hydrolase [Desulfobaccales bacterium]
MLSSPPSVFKSPFSKGGLRGIFGGSCKIPPDPPLRKGGENTSALFQSFLLVLFFWLLLALAPASPAHACTLFAAAGSRVEGGGTIIVKNRDRTPRRSAIKFIAPPVGFKFLALVDADAPHSSAVAGVNEKGLAVVDALPGNLPDQGENPGAIALSQALLSRCASVEEALACQDLFRASYPVIEMVADGRRIAMIEIAPQGRVAVKASGQGILCHTNHYLDPRLEDADLKPGSSSCIRYGRIGQLLSRQACPFVLEDFLAFSRDRRDGPDNSICRSGSTPTETRTLATWIVAHPAAGVPRVWVKISNPGEQEKITDLRLNPAWWANALEEKIFR